MKIKRLKIRNIASIERGEIDFENGLIDKETGKPASLFLITGNTGSGKSVILDCISMALYGTTPRVKSVNGIKNNIFSNGSGEVLSVNDICQYTRIGISWKYECYSELMFTGNDDIDYVARFSLGMTKYGNHQKPKWTLKIGKSEIIDNQKDEIKNIIEKAVGLSFDQFSRMAMLAQGQFATFLTGKKEERERILEQLTATDIFSRYGEAISAIFKRSKIELETSRRIFEEFSKNILDNDIRQSLIEEENEKKALAISCQKESEKLRHKISTTEAIKKAENEIALLKETSAKLKKLEDSEEFRKRIAILTLWDSTTHEREWLSEKIKATEKVTSEKKMLQHKKAELAFLSEDLATRKEEAQNVADSLEQSRLWIEEQSSRKVLYHNSPAVIASIQRYISMGTEIENKHEDSKKATVEIKIISKKISLLKKSTKQKNLQSKKLQKQISTQTSGRDKIKPSSLRTDRDLKLKRQFSLKDLGTRLESLEEIKKEAEKAKKQTVDIKNSLSVLQAEAKRETEHYENVEKEKNTAESRYRTMMMSVEKNFEAIRQQLVAEHASNCPLCGQSIQEHVKEWSKKDYFSNILSPLLEEKNKLSDDLTASKKRRDDVTNKMHAATGMLKAKEEELLKLRNRVDESQREIEEILTLLGIAASDNLKSHLSEEISILNKEIDSLTEKLSIADKLQTEIDNLLKEHASLDNDLKSEERKLNKEMESLAQKEAAIASAEERIKELKKEKESLSDEISNTLKGIYDDWHATPEETALQLKNDAENYYSTVSKYSKEEPEHRALMKILESISEMEQKLSISLKTSEPLQMKSISSDLKALDIEKIQEKWHNLHIDVSATLSRIEENELKITDTDKQLKEYYEESGKTETTLRQLIDSAEEITGMRTAMNAHNGEVSKNETLLAEAVKIKTDNLKALNLADESGLEDPAELKASLQSLVAQQGELTQRLGAIKEKLDADEKNRIKCEQQSADLELKTARMEKWYKMNKYFGSTRFRNMVQSHILRPLLHNANVYLRQITDHYTLTCSDENEQLSIFVLDRYYNNEPRSVTVLSGGERFMVSLALSLALSAMNRPDLNVDILFIDEGFGTLDAKSLDMVMSTLRRLPEINGQTGRRVGVISHREELTEQIDCQIRLRSYGEGRSLIEIK